MSNKALIELLKQNKTIKSSIVEKAMLATDRKLYVPRDSHYQAYQDTPLSIGYQQTISAPHMHAWALEILEPWVVRPKANVLDVGSGSGYLTACLSRMADVTGKVYGIERIKEVFEWSLQNLQSDPLDNPPQMSLSNAWTFSSPSPPPITNKDECNPEKDSKLQFDAIHVGAAAPSIPDSLLLALKKGGRMVIPVGSTGNQELLVVDKDQGGQLSQKAVMGVRYVPLVKDDI